LVKTPERSPPGVSARRRGTRRARRAADPDLRREVFLAVRRGALARPALAVAVAVARDAIKGAGRALAAR
jgi:hypothetical protein